VKTEKGKEEHVIPYCGASVPGEILVLLNLIQF